jgi:hypothetical protein
MMVGSVWVSRWGSTQNNEKCWHFIYFLKHSGTLLDYLELWKGMKNARGRMVLVQVIDAFPFPASCAEKALVSLVARAADRSKVRAGSTGSALRGSECK